MATILNNGETLLVGTAGNDLFLDMSDGEDSSAQTMVGGAGNDVYEVSSGEDFVLENAGGGTDTVVIANNSESFQHYDEYWGYWWSTEYYGVWDDYTLDANVENLTVYGANTGEGSFAFVGNADVNVIDISNTWGDGGELFGLGGNDTLIGSDGSDWLDGGAGVDRMVGGWGEDSYYVANVGDLVIEVTDNTATTSINEEQGEDTVYSDITYIAPVGVEHVVLWGAGPTSWGGEDWINGSLSTAAINATGNALDNNLLGNNGNNVLSGLGGNDFLLGEDGNDILSGGTHDDYLNGGRGNDNLDGGDGNDYLHGGGGEDGGNDVLLGGNGEDFLQGGFGNDRLDGGADNDFLGDTSGFVTYGEDGMVIFGGNDTLIGGLGNDEILSSYGADRLEGGAGNDFLMEGGEDGYDNATNVLLGGDGDDLIVVLDNYGANTLDGGNGNDVLIIGNSSEGEDGPPLMGYGGEDDFSGYVLNGGAGDDAYFILGHQSAEELTVLDSAGNDTIYLVNGEDSLREILGNDFIDGDDSAGYVSQGEDMDIFTMAAGIENLYADGLNDGEDNGANSMYLVGNAIDNRIVGTDDRDVLLGLAGNDTLEGGASADDMVGGAGNDLYILGDVWGSSAHDTVVEAANEGIDTVWAYESYKLENNVEHLRLFGGEDFRGTGNALDNSLTGNDGNNILSGGIGNDVLDGGAGNDRLYGGTGVDRLDGGSGEDFMNGGGGNDTYFVDNYGDTVFEFSDLQSGAQGPNIDTVFSSVSFALGANIENLTLTGSGDTWGWGNDENNIIVGNVGNNYLEDGSDGWNVMSPADATITGGGKDTLIGGAGNDWYGVNWDSSGIDVINDSAGTNDGVDLYVGTDFDSRDVFTLGAGNLLGIEHLNIFGDYDGVGSGPSNPDASGFTITGSTVANQIFASNVGDTIAGGGGNDTLWGADGADLLRGDANDDHLYGASDYNDDGAADTLQGGDGNDHLYSVDGGADRLEGGNGNDYYHIEGSTLGDNIFVELAAGGGNDVVEAWDQDINLASSLMANIEGAVMLGYGGSGASGDWTATGTSAANFFEVVDVNSNSDYYSDNITLAGLAGNDVYLIDDNYHNENLGYDYDGTQRIFIVEDTATTGGIDTVRTWVDLANYDSGISLADGVENLVLLASFESNGIFNTGAVNGMGNAGNNTITGNAGGHEGWNGSQVTSWYGNDLTGLGGNDNLIGDKGDDRLDGDYLNNSTLVGNDRMAGGAGDDEYIVNSTGDTVVELANQGDDWVGADNRNGAFTHTLAANVEDGTLLDGYWDMSNGNAGRLVGNQLDNGLYAGGMTGSATLDGGLGNDWLYGGHGSDTLLGGAGNDDLMGEDGNDRLEGGAGNDLLYGGYGSDNLIGGDGNDDYHVDSYGDVVTETNAAAAGGIDWVDTNGLSAYTLGNNVENLYMYNGEDSVMAVGNGLNNIIEVDYFSNDSSLSGGAGNDTLEGGWGSDWLDGGTGNDRMVGGSGSDIYYVDSTGDTAMEEGDEGYPWDIDWVYASNNSFNLATNGWNIENLIFTGTAVVSGIGNELGNIIDASSATSGSAYLQGGGGEDALHGGSGADILDGGAGSDWLDGGSGVDTMNGGMGDDVYMVDNDGDVVFEAPGNGFDTIYSSAVSYTNQSGVEVLQLQGESAATNATGLDTQDDTLIGNGNDNTLTGGFGNDWLSGGAGNDVLTGDGGPSDDSFWGNDWDTFALTDLSGGIDTITDFVGGDDIIAVSNGLFGYYGFEQQLYSSDFTSYDGTPPSWTNGANIGYNSADGSLWFSVIGDGSDLQQFGVVGGNPAITEADFIVI